MSLKRVLIADASATLTRLVRFMIVQTTKLHFLPSIQCIIVQLPHFYSHLQCAESKVNVHNLISRLKIFNNFIDRWSWVKSNESKWVRNVRMKEGKFLVFGSFWLWQEFGEQSKFTVSRDTIEADNENLVCIEWLLILYLTGFIVVTEQFLANWIQFAAFKWKIRP